MILSEARQARIRGLVDAYPQRRTALLPALKIAQDELGWLSPEVIAETADLVGVPHAAALELAGFYTMLHTSPGPATRLVVCAQLPCALRGAEGLLRDLQAGLAAEVAAAAVEIERTSECFGACHRAPMARENEVYRESLDDDARAALIARLKAELGVVA
jgi:NADH-quinone oxidoreductase subunit E